MKAHYSDPIDLTHDDDDVATEDHLVDNESFSIDEPMSFDSASDDESNNVYENCLMLTDSVEVTMDIKYQNLIGKYIWKGLWFQGCVASLDIGEVGGVETVFFHVEYDDDDHEDFEVDEWKKAPQDKSICLDDTSREIDNK